MYSDASLKLFVPDELESVCVHGQTPSFSRVQPDKGPVSGGTRLTVSGRHLDAGSAVTVFLAQEPCAFVR